jgi:hypothetical protein
VNVYGARGWRGAGSHGRPPRLWASAPAATPLLSKLLSEAGGEPRDSRRLARQPRGRLRGGIQVCLVPRRGGAMGGLRGVILYSAMPFSSWMTLPDALRSDPNAVLVLYLLSPRGYSLNTGS